ncbi:alkylated DNA repair protein [Burkholderia sp. Ch1-1]|uniref:Alkylated DNA repair protein n=1 Tax=Paraburkholderia dioscoreae TaxID=2604047 RepID=A0A5Q4ZU83_9BURK|nr:MULTISPECIES: alpha-ketoglutarate-dependent dioxygenase AlkB [Paraburkholderia]EIF34204.1 alkylated DNA repair protein [Burkholderia sp. Ch1-1]MDR8401413.1 alpha-ketoglutarate-dependent dioxygenase AlkB [Paraburkholderia sp. USG1]VVD33130.1 Alkylated DNA repair protein [Paraburkholderia dioscoreae]
MVSQQALFAPEPVSLLHDGEGGIRYLPESIPAATARQWFEVSLKNIGWLSRQRMMYDREVAVPRLIATFAREAGDLPAPLGEAFEAVRALVGAPFNRVGLNLYRNGSDSVALHSDKTDKLVPAQPIAIVSLGASRRMSIRPKAGSGRIVHIELEPGSCLVMSYASQFTHEHGIPKLGHVSGPRISLAFRCFSG